ncbi:hypothetical protein LINPERHAP1_LOCUS3814, partial [Linum perenne]
HRLTTRDTSKKGKELYSLGEATAEASVDERRSTTKNEDPLNRLFREQTLAAARNSFSLSSPLLSTDSKGYIRARNAAFHLVAGPQRVGPDQLGLVKCWA